MEENAGYMLRALELAELGRGKVSPNPMVGCVIVHNNKIIGEGYHQEYGGPHAEPNAIKSVDDKELLKESTVYVSLEPCAHFGKTPPCAHLLVDKQVKKVVIAAYDSNPLVGGKGIKVLEEAGIEVVTGVLEKEARIQNKRFFTAIEKERPYVILKWAQTLDGFIARKDYDSKWISNAYSRQLVHKWRSEEDAIMVGTKTAQYDNPKLNVRDWTGRDPLRIVLDKQLSLDSNLALFDQSIPTICYNLLKDEEQENLKYVKLERDFEIKDILADLHQRKVQSIIIEGGSHLLQKFIESELWDEARVFTGQSQFETGIAAPKISFPPLASEDIMGDRLEIFRSNK
ncbi:bifunctional diaminohydroxyphosphoribosylaminopyrimidine deaminase/5-amino-6-(5-phosphoribosylamino)uracil reductase RibD [Echinicola marina]|uniref:bifunctional diaminohydroxyphosphoribosylaminopyrimidine deaminase/5-amino-6-(5-phosphoribosylamino)uracil reductase RibD n=1 Tax=Echinicola marina TaxID=2859768 RepID=UPI001CF6323A|nr:bifunctional diaminohydroxyphosphoribosylaminopyrimidine deaminase/5-amino-6-(5-phosphoribosylamino)uracil reductase RibD [Echinicola marina]UCS94467.1 bifunctional diaminohydroxyphosphoribosylaminopyrimidine deaminase/5-amino-6-(5-phosphoribosylamino)uracil reductase RibD [Echinicola marina]